MYPSLGQCCDFIKKFLPKNGILIQNIIVQPFVRNGGSFQESFYFHEQRGLQTLELPERY
jgi:hypothetical protein